MHMMREKTQIVKPEIDELKKHIKDSETQEEKLKHNQALINLYKKYDINHLCLFSHHMHVFNLHNHKW